MRKLTATLMLAAVLCVSALAGEIPGSGKQDPPPAPSPTPLENNSTTTTDDLTLETVLIDIYLSLFRI